MTGSSRVNKTQADRGEVTPNDAHMQDQLTIRSPRIGIPAMRAGSRAELLLRL
jgi:hypothetical protein